MDIKDFSGYKYYSFEKSRNLGKLILLKKNDGAFLQSFEN